MKNIYTEEQRMYHAKECLNRMASGQTMKSYAIDQGIIPRTLQNWITKYRKQYLNSDQEHKRAFVKISSPRANEGKKHLQTSSLKVCFGSLAVELPSGNSDTDLKRVLAALKEIV